MGTGGGLLILSCCCYCCRWQGRWEQALQHSVRRGGSQDRGVMADGSADP